MLFGKQKKDLIFLTSGDVEQLGIDLNDQSRFEKVDQRMRNIVAPYKDTRKLALSIGKTIVRENKLRVRDLVVIELKNSIYPNYSQDHHYEVSSYKFLSSAEEKVKNKEYMFKIEGDIKK